MTELLSLPLVAIIGRPNVGKSTLFNRLVGRRLALVDDRPGVTRDRREGEARLYDLLFRIVDTAGLEEAERGSLAERMRVQSEFAATEAAVSLFLFDARVGVTPQDEHFAGWLRRSGRPVIVVANKCEGHEAELNRSGAYTLGLGEAIPFSAEHGLGLSDLHDALAVYLRPAEEAEAPAAIEAAAIDEAGATGQEAASEDETAAPDPSQPLQLAIIGRPNVGKSTLVNRLIGEDRLLTGPEAGITRDAITVEWSYKGQAIRLVDTAGLRRRARIDDKIEKLAGADSRRALRYAHIVVLVVDAEQPLERQDLAIAELVLEEGRGLVVAVNKWDAVEDAKATLALVRDRIERALPRAKGLPVVTVSALRGRNLDRLLDACLSLYKIWNSRVRTGDLNRWLEEMVSAHPPPAPSGRRIRVKYMTQVKARPPTFALFASQADALPESYLRYLENGLREAFDLQGTPIRIQLRTGKNPYATKR